MALSARIGADFSEFTAAMDKVEVKVKTASEIAKNAGRDFDRLVASFDGTKVQRDAQLMVAAIEKLGGAGTLTAKEQARVNTQVTEAIAKYHALGQQAPPAMQALADATKQAAVHQRSFLDSVLATAAGFVTAQAALAVFHAGYSAVKSVLLGSVQAASEEEIALTKLRTALIQQGTAAPSVIAAYEGLARQYERTTVFSDHLLQSTMGTLAVVGGVMPRDMDTALKAVTNLASAFGGEQGLDKATLAVAKAAEGNITGLKRMGVVVDESKYKTEGFSAVLDAINAKFGGQAQALAETYTGRLAQMANAWDAVKEGIGHAIVQNRTVLETIASVTGAVQGNTADLAKNAEVMNLVSDATILLVRGFGLAGSVADLAQLTFQSLRIATEQTLAATANLAIGFLDTFVRVQNLQKFVNPSAWTSGSQQATKDAAAASEWLKGMVKGLDADSLDAIDDSIKYGNALQGLSAKADALAAQLEKTRGKVSALKEGTDSGTDAWNRHTVAVGKAAAEAKKLAEAWVSLVEKVYTQEHQYDVDKLFREMFANAKTWEEVSKTLPPYIVEAIRSAVAEAQRQLDTLPPFDIASILTGKGGMETFSPWSGMGKALATDLTKVFENIPATIAQALTGGGGMRGAWEAVGSQIGAALGKHVGTSLTQAIGGSLGKAIGAAMPAIGALLGPALGALFDKLTKAEGKKVNDLRDAYISAAGGLATLNAKAAAAGMTLTELLRIGKVKDYEAAVAKLNRALEVTAQLDTLRAQSIPTWNTISALAEKYGISVASAGQAVQQLMVNANAQSVLNDWQTWTKAGGDLDVFAKASAKTFASLVQQATLFGTTLPENLRPVLQSLIDQGLLLDKAGQKIDDLSQLAFGEAVQTETERLAKAIEDLVAELRALNALPAVAATRPTDYGAGVTGGGLQRVVNDQDTRMSGRAVNITVQAWDGASVDTWLRQGGARQLAEAAVPEIPGVVQRYGLT